jgi:hypothetical protein
MSRLLVGLNYRIGSNWNVAALRAILPSVANALSIDAVVSPCGEKISDTIIGRILFLSYFE